MKLDELAERTGEGIDTLARYIALGVLPEADAFTLADVERVRLVQLLRRRGIELEAIGDAQRSQLDLFDGYLAQVYPDADYPSVTLDDAVERTGIDIEFAQRVRDAGGLGGPGERLSEGDIEAMRALALALSVGFPEDAILQVVRVYADALNRVGEAEARLFHFHVHERLRAEGLAGPVLDAALAESIENLAQLVEPAVLYFHRRGLAHAIRDDLALHLAQDAGLVAPDDETGRLVAAIAFIDLARFTALTEAMGDATAAELLNRFSDLVRRHVAVNEGRIVKQIGDAFMLVFGDPRSAVECALDLRAAAVAEPHFLGMRQGLHWGPVLYREGDYYGGTVNLAARIVAEAASDAVLISAEVHKLLADVPEIEVVHMGRRTIKHLADPIDVYEAFRPGERAGRPRVIDPVCGMHVDPAAPAARLQFNGRHFAFCSQSCLQRFVAGPDRYA